MTFPNIKKTKDVKVVRVKAERVKAMNMKVVRVVKVK
jgi:hypothetical protein